MNPRILRDFYQSSKSKSWLQLTVSEDGAPWCWVLHVDCYDRHQRPAGSRPHADSQTSSIMQWAIPPEERHRAPASLHILPQLALPPRPSDIQTPPRLFARSRGCWSICRPSDCHAHRENTERADNAGRQRSLQPDANENRGKVISLGKCWGVIILNVAQH